MLPLTQLVTSQLATINSFTVTSALGLFAHLVFNQFEPTVTDPTGVLVLLVVIPGASSIALLPCFGSYPLAIAATFSTYISVLLCSIVLYRVSSFHPLARYPGPVLHKISKIWVAWISRDGKQHVYLEKLHQQYGDVVRVGPNELSIRDPSAIAPLHGADGLPKGPQMSGRQMKTTIPNLISIRDRQLHMQRRTHWLRGLNTAALKGYEPIIEKRVRQFVDRLGNSEGSEIDLSQLLSHFSYDFMSDMAFGGGSEMMRDGDIHGLWKLQENSIVTGYFFGHIPWIVPFVCRLSFLTGNVVKFRRFAIGAAEKRKKEGSQIKDLFYHLIDEGSVDKEPPTLAQVVSDGSLAIVAGSDTTTTVLSSLFYFLVGNPQAYSRLRAEVDKFYPADGDGLSTQFHGSMPYLAACINESLRLIPPVPGGSQRASTKGMGAKMIGPYYIPEETIVSTHFYAIQRDPCNFSPRTNQFWPERWLIADGLESPPDDFVHDVTAFTPFSYGPADCVGKRLALQEMKTVVCLVMQKLEMRFAGGYDQNQWYEDMRDFGIVMRGSLPVVVTRRK